MAPPQPPFQVREIAATPAVQLFEVEGELDLSSADVLGDSLSSASGNVIVDLTGCPLIDSTGLALLLRAAQRLQRDSGALAVVVNDPEIRRLFEITGLDLTIAVHATRDKALADSPTGE
jgi:anti-anti-sigma factor